MCIHYSCSGLLITFFSSSTEPEEAPTGIPNFWLTVLQNAAPVNDMIHEHDIPILRHLNDIKIAYHTDNERPVRRSRCLCWGKGEKSRERV